jgi:hypothetical protein
VVRLADNARIRRCNAQQLTTYVNRLLDAGLQREWRRLESWVSYPLPGVARAAEVIEARNHRVAWYSTKAWFSRGSRASGSSTIDDMLSGITVADTPSKNAQAASNPSITASVV